MNDRDAEVKVTMQGLEIVKVVMFKYLESPTQSNIQRGAEEVKKKRKKKSASVRGDL